MAIKKPYKTIPENTRPIRTIPVRSRPPLSTLLLSLCVYTIHTQWYYVDKTLILSVMFNMRRKTITFIWLWNWRRCYPPSLPCPLTDWCSFPQGSPYISINWIFSVSCISLTWSVVGWVGGGGEGDFLETTKETWLRVMWRTVMIPIVYHLQHPYLSQPSAQRGTISQNIQELKSNNFQQW